MVLKMGSKTSNPILNMTQQEKIKKLEQLFGEIKKLFSDNSIKLYVHSIDMEQLPEGWKTEKNIVQEKNIIYMTAKNVNIEIDGITLFD